MDDELEVMRELTQHPELLELVKQHSGTELQLQSKLREQYPAGVVRAAVSLVELRQRGRTKFSRAEEMWFDRTGLEQSTPEAVALHKALRFQSCTEPVFDLCSGIGSDTVALARQGQRVISVDLSPVASARAQRNAAVFGVAERIEFRVGDATEQPVTGAFVHIDPDRRAGRQRVIRIEDYQPSLEFLEQLIATTRGAAIKLSPASNFGGKFTGCEVELISLQGECKEATVWSGELAGHVAMRATVLPSGFTLGGNPWEHRSSVGSLGRFVYDPDPAVVRAGLVDALAEQLQLTRLDDTEEYLTSTELVSSPAVQAFEVIANLPNNDREIRNTFRDLQFGEVEIKSRHVPTAADAIRKKLPLSGKGKGVLLYARLAGKTRALIARRIQSEAESESQR
ncbi:class I SAM-dependent methyltransferase [Planctomicrobium sp. SH664]|uniref:class I SAM-dependent methyltransferase n=1 Tax=Planctomicrobium sp. SH664 TaxID=3448125 RepID=UPI003F5B70CB